MLFDVDVRTINEHLKNIYTQNELSAAATILKFRIVAARRQQAAISRGKFLRY